LSVNGKLPGRPGQRYMMAVVLGTALTTMSPVAAAAVEVAGPQEKVIADLSRYCTTCWRNARLPVHTWGDCTQEVFRRLLERLPTDSWSRVLKGEGEERKEFVRAIDAVKKRTQRARKFSDQLDGVADGSGAGRRETAEQRALVQEAATEVLTPRQQRILQMSFEGWTVQDMAAEMGLPPERVSDEKYKAVRKLRGHLSEGEA